MLSLFAVSFLTYLQQWRVSHSGSTAQAVKYLCPCLPALPHLGPGMSCSCNMSPHINLPWAPIPDLHKSRRQSFKKEGVLLHIISLQDPCWAGMAKWVQLSISWDMCGWLLWVDTRLHDSFSLKGTQKHTFTPLTICKYVIYSMYVFHFFTSCEF